MSGNGDASRPMRTWARTTGAAGRRGRRAGDGGGGRKGDSPCASDEAKRVATPQPFEIHIAEAAGLQALGVKLTVVSGHPADRPPCRETKGCKIDLN